MKTGSGQGQWTTSCKVLCSETGKDSLLTKNAAANPTEGTAPVLAIPTVVCDVQVHMIEEVVCIPLFVSCLCSHQGKRFLTNNIMEKKKDWNYFKMATIPSNQSSWQICSKWKGKWQYTHPWHKRPCGDNLSQRSSRQDGQWRRRHCHHPPYSTRWLACCLTGEMESGKGRRDNPVLIADPK